MAGAGPATAGFEAGVGQGGARLAVGRDQRDEADAAGGHREIGDGGDILGQRAGHPSLGHVERLGGNLGHVDAGVAVLGNQPPAEAHLDQPERGEAKPYGREIEHLEGFAELLLAHLADDDVGRSSDERDQAAEQRHEGHRHQQGGRTAVLGSPQPDRDRHQRGERANVLGHHREQRRGAGEHRHLACRARETCRKRAHKRFNHARPADRRAHHQRAGDDDHDIAGEACERIVGLHITDQHRDQQHHQRYEIVAKPPPHEEDHGKADEADRDKLFLVHARGGPAQTMKGAAQRAMAPDCMASKCAMRGLVPDLPFMKRRSP